MSFPKILKFDMSYFSFKMEDIFLVLQIMVKITKQKNFNFTLFTTVNVLMYFHLPFKICLRFFLLRYNCHITLRLRHSVCCWFGAFLCRSTIRHCRVSWHLCGVTQVPFLPVGGDVRGRLVWLGSLWQCCVLGMPCAPTPPALARLSCKSAPCGDVYPAPGPHSAFFCEFGFRDHVVFVSACPACLTQQAPQAIVLQV